MNRHLLSATAVVIGLLLMNVNANAQAFNKGQQAFSAGYGLGTLNGAVNNVLNNYGIQSQSLYGPYYAKYEKGLTKHIGFGFNASVVRNDWTLNTGARISEVSGLTSGAQAEVLRWSYSAVARLNYHFAKKANAKLDPYFGTGIGYRSSNWKVESASSEFDGLTRYIPNTPLAFEFTLGARYYFLPNMGVYAEFGGSKSLLQGGLIMNIPNGTPKRNKPTGNTGGGTSNGGGTSGGGKGGTVGTK
jgi:hypothetical protein